MVARGIGRGSERLNSDDKAFGGSRWSVGGAPRDLLQNTRRIGVGRGEVHRRERRWPRGPPEEPANEGKMSNTRETTTISAGPCWTHSTASSLPMMILASEPPIKERREI